MFADSNILQPDPCLLDPLVANSNCVLTFTVRSGEFIEDPETGNRTPAAVTPIELNATVKYMSKPLDTEQQFFEGQDQQVRWLEGHLVNPLTVPDSVGHLSEGIATVNGQRGKVIFYNPRTNPLVGTVLGTKIYLVFLKDRS